LATPVLDANKDASAVNASVTLLTVVKLPQGTARLMVQVLLEPGAISVLAVKVHPRVVSLTVKVLRRMVPVLVTVKVHVRLA